VHLTKRKYLPSEFEGTLDRVTDNGRTETGQESTGSLLGDNLSESTDHTLVVDLGLELDSGLDDINFLQLPFDARI
jgi:hypothetical protein